ncbi:uncharacterized protein A4U43_C08F19840 [Asparagus officinalis]|nr:uncharacterized protein A4U43_C08F19840 [Asparagus officinalis]
MSPLRLAISPVMSKLDWDDRDPLLLYMGLDFDPGLMMGLFLLFLRQRPLIQMDDFCLAYLHRPSRPSPIKPSSNSISDPILPYLQSISSELGEFERNSGGPDQKLKALLEDCVQRSLQHGELNMLRVVETEKLVQNQMESPHFVCVVLLV